MILNLSHYHTAKRERKIHDRKAAKSKIRFTPICGGYGLQSCRADDFEYDAFFYGRMKASTRHETKNGDYNRFLVFTALLCAIVTVVAICVKKDTAGALPISIGVLIFVTTVRYYADVEYRLSLNYRGFFFYYLFIAVGYAIGIIPG